MEGPSFVSLISNNRSLKLEPKNCSTDFGSKKVVIKFEDEEPAFTLINIEIEVPNN